MACNSKCKDQAKRRVLTSKNLADFGVFDPLRQSGKPGQSHGHDVTHYLTRMRCTRKWLENMTHSLQNDFLLLRTILGYVMAVRRKVCDVEVFAPCSATPYLKVLRVGRVSVAIRRFVQVQLGRSQVAM
jgi:hypothetical protein